MGVLLTLGGAGLLSILGFSSLLHSEKVDTESLGGASLDTDSIIENGKNFAEKYQLDSVLDDSSQEPYISSNEMVRPDTGSNNNNDKEKKTSGKALATSFLVGAGASALADDKIRMAVNWLLVGVLAVGGFWAYKELSK